MGALAQGIENLKNSWKTLKIWGAGSSGFERIPGDTQEEIDLLAIVVPYWELK